METSCFTKSCKGLDRFIRKTLYKGGFLMSRIPFYAFVYLCVVDRPTLEHHLDFAQEAPDNVIERIHFRSIGPTKQTGRFMQVGVPDLHKQPFTFYAASSTGGLWKTTDNGVTYKPVFDNEETLVLSDVEVSFSEPDIVYVAPGTSLIGEKVCTGRADGGETWNQAGLNDSYFISKIVIHPEDPDIVYAAVPG